MNSTFLSSIFNTVSLNIKQKLLGKSSTIIINCQIIAVKKGNEVITVFESRTYTTPDIDRPIDSDNDKQLL